MASLCRSALMAQRSRALTQGALNALNPKPISSSSSAFASSTKPMMSSATRFVSVLGSLETMMPLHSVVASARLKSNIAFDSTCWSCLSQGLASPL
ncbi:protein NONRESPONDING TO OXYLIPINS 2, mitochondrial isoform X2 [Argentina anserina]|uniref:protein NONRESPONDING TO OXYLIPINS 2, mitochondrial isoform X2 n=1 Tax=Argentina anserina TaxID=57926 RepID=UPI0021761ED6|nr:protein NONRESPONDING TO OXYLIPINS 2, mitochondrial isoform X2 [Potentilla anserina]